MKYLNKPKVYVVCAVYNNLSFTRRLLADIENQTYKNVIITIVDDRSTDGTYEYIKRFHPNVIVLRGIGNLWWTGSLYWGIEEIMSTSKKGDFVLTINNDCRVAQNYISELVDASISHNRAITGSLIVDEKTKTRIWDAGVKMDWEKGEFIALGPRTVNEIPPGDKFQKEEIDILSTKGTLFPIEVFLQIGNFERKIFPHYLSDYEFSYRAKRSGFNLILSLKARVYNDILNTGIGGFIPDRLPLKQIFTFLFSRKSKLNIIDQINFVKLCCPPEYKLRNYIQLCKKLITISKKVDILHL